MSFSSVRKCQRFLRLLESIVPVNDEPGFFDMAPHTSLAPSEVFHGLHAFDERGGDTAEHRRAVGQDELYLSLPDGSRRTARASVFGLGFVDDSVRMVLGAHPAIIERQKPNSNALPALHDGSFIDYADAVFSL